MASNVKTGHLGGALSLAEVEEVQLSLSPLQDLLPLAVPAPFVHFYATHTEAAPNFLLLLMADCEGRVALVFGLELGVDACRQPLPLFEGAAGRDGYVGGSELGLSGVSGIFLGRAIRERGQGLRQTLIFGS